ncbi:hypothetical protein J3R83DRAFT_13021 [Lanmaoa asiatica]|nr:hypothetical protein J3R83DRAFT_13021 [Lanmaoa asiatica]
MCRPPTDRATSGMRDRTDSDTEQDHSGSSWRAHGSAEPLRSPERRRSTEEGSHRPYDIPLLTRAFEWPSPERDEPPPRFPSRFSPGVEPPLTPTIDPPRGRVSAPSYHEQSDSRLLRPPHYPDSIYNRHRSAPLYGSDDWDRRMSFGQLPPPGTQPEGSSSRIVLPPVSHLLGELGMLSPEHYEPGPVLPQLRLPEDPVMARMPRMNEEEDERTRETSTHTRGKRGRGETEGEGEEKRTVARKIYVACDFCRASPRGPNPRSVSPERTGTDVVLPMSLVVDNSDLPFLPDSADRHISRQPIRPFTPVIHTNHYSPNGMHPGTAGNALDPLPGNARGYTLMVAGQRTGKTSFLRLLLDTSDISQTASKDQLASVAKFVQGCSGHTSHIRSASINIDLDLDPNTLPLVLALTLIDTPSLDFTDDHAAERTIQEIIRQVDTRFADGIDDDWKAQTGDHNIHLCIYFLDPDMIVPPSVPGPPAPLVSRARTNSFSHTDTEPVILEPPVTTNPILCRPTLPAVEINTIRRLSARVNVLPVIARADTLTNDRLTAVKMAVRRDLAEAGIGFGIFDMDTHPQYQHRKDVAESGLPVKSEMVNGYGSHTTRSSPGQPSPPTSPATPSFLRLPYALISPEIYSHSDGVTRLPLSRHELVQQYTPPPHQPSSSKLARGKFIRSYRWGSMDVLDPSQCDFLPLRHAIFHHMETLQKYTREYLFDKFRNEYLIQHHSANHPLHAHQIQQNMVPRTQLSALSHTPRPILSIETCGHGAVRHPSLSIPRDVPPGTEAHTMPISRTMGDGQAVPPNHVKTTGRSSKQRTKKITVACNFCRCASQKLFWNMIGTEPIVPQLVNLNAMADVLPATSKRRNSHRRKEDESESEGSAEERSVDENDPSVSPEMPSQPLSRRSSNVERRPVLEGFSQAVAGPSEPREPLPIITPVVRPKHAPSGPPAPDGRPLFKDNELPHIATLALPESSPAATMTAPPLPPIRPASEQQAAQRKRASTVPGRTPRQTTSAGPKVVACNFCRARKTKCDGAHPACSSCARRSLPCNYNHDSSNNGANKKGSRRASLSSKVPPSVVPPSVHSPPTQSPPSSTVVGDVRYQNGTPLEDTPGESMDVDLKRKIDDIESSQIQKRMRVDESTGHIIP